MVRVKICGITDLHDALAAVDAGYDALGFVFYKKSPRYIEPRAAANIISHLPKQIVKVGVFVNAKEEQIKKIAKLCRLNMLQFHGSESPAFCAKFKDYKVIKAFRVRRKLDPEAIRRYKVFAYMFDTFVESKAGGTGKSFNWKFIPNLNDLKRPVFLSGGLCEKNVLAALHCVRPHWVDVSTGVELYPGKKHHHKLRKFIHVTKSKKGRSFC
ncbi:phosphoribosylanthranilate isomerase [Candidatus Omnitrophota bacterium]